MVKKNQLINEDIANLFLLLLCQFALIRCMIDLKRMFDRILDPIHQAYLRDGSVVIP